MVKLRKFLAVVFFLAFALTMSLLAMYWFNVEPVASFMQSNRGDVWLDYGLCIAIGISVVGALVVLIRTLALRSKKTFQKSKTSMGVVQISRATMVREVNRVIDSHPEVKRLKTSVEIRNRRKNPYANVQIRIAPRGSLSMPEVAGQLQSEVKDALKHLTGNDVHSVLIDVRRGSDGDDSEKKGVEKNPPAQVVAERADADVDGVRVKAETTIVTGDDAVKVAQAAKDEIAAAATGAGQAPASAGAATPTQADCADAFNSADDASVDGALSQAQGDAADNTPKTAE